MDKSQNYYAGWKKPDKEHILCASIYIKSQKMQTKRQLSCCLGNEEGGGGRQEWEITNGLEKTVRGEVDVVLIVVVVSWVQTFVKSYRMAHLKYVQFITC